MNNLRALKVWMLLVGIAALLAGLFWAVTDGRQVRISTQRGVVEGEVDMAAMVSATQATAVLKEARYFGETSGGEAWEVRADEVVQTGNMDATVVRLGGVSAALGNDVAVTAARGEYVQVSHTLVLDGGVVLAGQGFTMAMPSAWADVGAMVVESRGGGVEVSGTLGGMDVVLTAQALQAEVGRERMVFIGNVHGVMEE